MARFTALADDPGGELELSGDGVECRGLLVYEQQSSDARLTTIERQDEGHRALRHSRRGRAVWEQPGKRLGHRLNQARVLLAREVLLREEPERRAERRGEDGLRSEQPARLRQRDPAPDEHGERSQRPLSARSLFKNQYVC